MKRSSELPSELLFCLRLLKLFPRGNNIEIAFIMCTYIAGGNEMEFLTTSEAAKNWNISRRRVSLLCAEGRITGAIHKGNMWLVPDDAKKPEDPRRKEKKEQ